jgi:hypothetical protein
LEIWSFDVWSFKTFSIFVIRSEILQISVPFRVALRLRAILPAQFPCNTSITRSEVGEVVPAAGVWAGHLEDDDVLDRSADFGEIGAIGADEGGDTLDGRHPHVIEDDVTAGLAEEGSERKIDQSEIEAMIAIDEDGAEAALFADQTGECLHGIVVSMLEDSLGSAEDLVASEADAVPSGDLIGIDGEVVAFAIGVNCGEKKYGGKTEAQAYFQGAVGLGLADEIVDLHAFAGINASLRIERKHPVFEAELRLGAIHRGEDVCEGFAERCDDFSRRARGSGRPKPTRDLAEKSSHSSTIVGEARGKIEQVE